MIGNSVIKSRHHNRHRISPWCVGAIGLSFHSMIGERKKLENQTEIKAFPFLQISFRSWGHGGAEGISAHAWGGQPWFIRSVQRLGKILFFFDRLTLPWRLSINGELRIENWEFINLKNNVSLCFARRIHSDLYRPFRKKTLNTKSNVALYLTICTSSSKIRLLFGSRPTSCSSSVKLWTWWVGHSFNGLWISEEFRWTTTY